MEDLQLITWMRCCMYDVLRRFFIEEPSLDYIAYCKKHGLFSQYPLQDLSEEIKSGVAEIARYLNEHDLSSGTDDYEQLHWDYTRMFIGPLSLPAPPWASYYLEKDQMLFQNVTYQVKLLYQQYGLSAGNEADDHIGLELAFLHHLCVLTSNALEQGRIDTAFALLGEQEAFIHRHLLAWAPQFSRRIEDEAQTSFFFGLAKVLRGSLHIDAELVSDSIRTREAAAQ